MSCYRPKRCCGAIPVRTCCSNPVSVTRTEFYDYKNAMKSDMRDLDNRILDNELDLSELELAVSKLELEKQNKLVAGANITLTNNPDNTTTISSTGGGSDTYTAGDGIVISSENVISTIMQASDYYNKVEIDNIITNLEGLKMEVVSVLPTTGLSNTIYLLELAGGGYEQWIYSNDQWVDIGSASIDLTDYYTKTETDDLLDEKQDKLVAGEGITIDSTTNVISATGGGGATDAVRYTVQSLTESQQEIARSNINAASRNDIIQRIEMPDGEYSFADESQVMTELPIDTIKVTGVSPNTFYDEIAYRDLYVFRGSNENGLEVTAKMNYRSFQYDEDNEILTIDLSPLVNISYLFTQYMSICITDFLYDGEYDEAWGEKRMIHDAYKLYVDRPYSEHATYDVTQHAGTGIIFMPPRIAVYQLRYDYAGGGGPTSYVGGRWIELIEHEDPLGGDPANDYETDDAGQITKIAVPLDTFLSKL